MDSIGKAGQIAHGGLSYDLWFKKDIKFRRDTICNIIFIKTAVAVANGYLSMYGRKQKMIS